MELIFIALVLLSALFSSSETAFFSLNLIRIERLAKEGSKKAREILNLLSKPADLIATILIGNEMVNIAIASTSAVFFVETFGEEIGSMMAVPITLLIVLIFGEITPKTLAIKNAEKYSFFILPFIKTFYAIVSPLRFVAVGLSERILGIFGVELFNKPRVLSEEEFLILVSQSEESGTICKEEGKLLKKTFELDRRKVKDVMIPAEKVFCLDEGMPLKEAVKKLKEAGFSRAPVVDGEKNVKGIVHVKTLIPHYVKRENLEVPVVEFASEPITAEPDLPLDRLLQTMQKEKKHMAVVCSNGKLLGIITLDDILNVLLGE